MKFAIFFFLIIFSFFASGQDTLRELNTSMFSKYYVLNANGTFDFYYAHCTGIEYGTGKYQKTKNEISFSFSENLQKNDSIACFKDSNSDSINIKVFSYKNTTEFPVYKILANNQVYTYFAPEQLLPKIDAEIDSISVRVIMSPPIKLYPKKNNCNVYKIYLGPLFSHYSGPKSVEMELLKNGNYKYIVSREKYNRKGERTGKMEKVVWTYGFENETQHIK